MGENEFLQGLSEDDLAKVSGGANGNPGDVRSMEDILAELRNAGEAMRAQNEAMRQAGRDAAVAESQAAAERIQQSAADNLVVGQLSAAATGGPSAFRDAVNGLKQNGMWEQISPSLRQKLEGRL